MTAVWLLLTFSISFLLISLKHVRSVRSFSVFALDRGSFGVWTLYATTLASGVGAGQLMGGAEKAYVSGFAYSFACMGFVAQLLFTAWLAPRVYLWRDCLSSGEMFGQAYGCQKIRCLCGLIWIAFCIGIISAQVVAMERVASLLLLDWRVEAGLLLSGIVIIYSALGGIKSVVRTDVIQAALLFSALFLMVLWGVGATGGKEAFIEVARQDITSSSENLSLLSLTFLFIGFLFGDALIPVSVQRINMAKSPWQARNALVIAAFVVLLVILMSASLGLIASQIDDSRPAQDTFSLLLAEAPEGLKMLMLLGLLAAVMSSCDSYLNTAAVACVNDVIPVYKDNLGEQKKLKAGRWCTLLAGLIAIALAYGMNDILDILLASFELWGPTLFPTLLLTLYYRKLPRSFFYCPVICGVAMVLFWKLVVSDPSLEPGALPAGILANTVCILCLLYLKGSGLSLKVAVGSGS
ncbi:sodium:solute symporter family protein [Endozoicomonas arenosclerae]|uniref:sodium:solute symporter family protein n=1 Tax=Endozoicomonas arenosclerae TaxID=1633495 RepID=UPI0007821A3B|nr:sodium:solute symporter family protein [Endozoicomonas arenosclerae]